MRILNIFFKNINSLEGEGRIYFDQGPIADSGLFAITGPNGSGKTSILDVITLGLYGETFRFDKPAAHVITKQTSEGFAQVEFALGQEKFRSSWRVKSDGPISPSENPTPEMTLTRIADQEEILAETPHQVRNRIAELTGMDFHKFSKSMVLPQGDFSAFLNALDSERMDILEKISGTDIYADYRQQAENQFTQAQTRLVQLQQDYASIPLLSDEALDAAEQDLQDFKDQVAELQNRQQQTQQQLIDLQNFTSLEQQQQQIESRRQSLLSQIGHYQHDLQRITAGQSATQFQHDLAQLDEKQSRIEQLRTTLDGLRRELALLQQQLGTDSSDVPATDKSLDEQQQAIDSLKLTISEIKLELPRQHELSQAIQQQLTDNQASLADVERWLQIHRADASLLDDFPDIARLRNLRTESAELNGKQKKQANWTKNTLAALKKNKSALESTQASLRDLKDQIDADQEAILKLSQGKSFDELKELLLDQQTRVSDFQELYSLAEVTARLSKKGWFSWFGRKQEDELPDASELTVRLETLREEMAREENIGKVLEQALRNEALIKKMRNDRAKLVEGQPCFLCGSTTHPYVLKPPVFTDAKKALVDQRGKVQALKLRIDNTNIQLNAAQKRITQMTAKQKRLKQMHSDWTLLANRLSIMRGGMDIDNLSLQKRLLEEETQEQDRITHLVKELAQLQRNVAKATTEIDNKQALLQKLTATVEELETTWNNRPPAFIEVEQRFASCTEELNALTAKLEKQLSDLGEKLPAKGKENPLFDRLNSRRQDYQVYQLRQKGLQDDIQALNDKLQACQNTITAYQQRMSSSLDSLSNQERLGLHLAIIEKQKLIIEEEQQLRATQIELEIIQRNLGERLPAAGIATVEDLRSILALIAREADIRQRYHADSEQLTQLTAQLEQLASTMTEQSELIANLPAEEDISRALKALGEQIDIAKQEIHGLQNTLEKQQRSREKRQLLQEQLDAQLSLFNQADAEIKLINDPQGGFRRKVQQVMIDNLLSHANRILEKLSGRYYVRGVASDHGLGLEIEDTKQKNVHRLPQTLSGGESFVVSLALALALTEIANNGKAIDSLFLDEGFGNLDSESLYLAMTTLENLKTQGKTVGVISHVEGVRKRIKTQIELVKKANGLSELKMVA